MLLSLLIFSLLLVPGCEKREEKEKLAVPPVEKKAIATPPVESAMSALLELEKNPEARRALESSHQDWIKLRISHCAAVGIPDKEQKGATKLQECYEAFDRQRIELLNQQRIGLLFDLPPQSGSVNPAISIPYSAETKKNPSAPHALVVASAAPVAAVTFTDMTELFDLVSGQLINRIQTADAEKRRGVYYLFLSPNGRVLTASYHWPKTGVKIWDVKSGDLLRDTLISPYFLRAPTSRGRYFIYSERNRIGVYDIVKDEPAWRFEDKQGPSHMALSPDDRWLIVVRGQNIESWESTGDADGRISFVLRNSEMVGNYNFQPTWIAFSRDNRSFYGSLPRNGGLVQWQLPDLKVLRRLRFPRYQSVKLIQIPQSDTFLLEGRPSRETLEAFAVDMAREASVPLFDHTGVNSRVAPGGSDQVLIATPFLFKNAKIPDPAAFRPFSHVLGGVVAEPTVAPSPGGDSASRIGQVQADCRGFLTEAVGVYEGSLPGGAQRGFQSKVPGYVTVSVGRTDLPLKLLLSSYEPVHWQLRVSANARLSEVLLAGSNESRIEGLDTARITYIGNAYAYKEGNAARLADLARRHTGCSITRFQGAYRGSNFYIGEGVASKGGAINRQVDEEGNVVYRNY